MKNIYIIVLFLVSSLAFSQNDNTILGSIYDSESINEPLIFANITLKETGEKVMSNEKGIFSFKNLEEGQYTLVSSFTGYQTEELKIAVLPNRVSAVKIQLKPETISLEDLVLTMASADSNTSRN